MLRTHVGEPSKAPIDGATRYKREPSREPEERLKDLLAEFSAANGRLPAGNVVG